MHLPHFALTLAALIALQDPAVKTGGVDFSKIDRKIASEPKYVATPKYALLLLGPEGKTKIWMALDKSRADVKDYDVAYFDRDGDGNLGEEGERVAGTTDEHGRIVFDIGNVEAPESKLVLENVQVATYPKEAKPMTFVTFKANGKVKMYGGYGPGNTYLEFGDSTDKAPLVHADPFGTLSFFHEGPAEMEIGKHTTVMAFVGNRGSGAATFFAVDEHFLDLEMDKIIVTVIAKDAKGQEIRGRGQLKEHC
jgi:hypothetical protein